MSVQDYQEKGQRRFFKINAKECKLLESVKDWEVWTDVPRKSVEGNFVKLEKEEKEFEGKKTEYLRLYLQDGEETYVVNTSWSALWQQMVNTLAGELANGKKLGKLSLSVWSKTVDKKEYPRLTIRNNGDETQWRYSIEEQKAMIEIIENSKWEYKGKDSSTYIDTLSSHIETINNNDPEDKMFEPEDIV